MKRFYSLLLIVFVVSIQSMEIDFANPPSLEASDFAPTFVKARSTDTMADKQIRRAKRYNNNVELLREET
jgi:hypothetical protein